MKLVYLFLLAAAWVWIECFIGGTRLVYSIPAYALIAVAALLTLARIRVKETPPPDAFCLGSTLLLGGWILFRSSHSPVDYLALRDFYMMLACLMLYLLTAFYFSGLREKITLIFVLGAISVLEVWCGLIQFFKDQEFMLFGQLRTAASWRASGMFVNANHFAGFMVTVAAIFLCFGVWGSQRTWVRAVSLYLAAMCWVGVAISGSRGGYFATAGSLLCFVAGTLYIVRHADIGRFAVGAVGSLGLAIVVAVAAMLTLKSNYLLSSRMEKTPFSDDIRIYNWGAALDHFRLSPWIGTGAGTHLIYGRLFRRVPNQTDPVHAHCDYLELVAEYGVVGGCCMALFLIAHFRGGLRSSFPRIPARLLHIESLQSDRSAIQFGALCAVTGLAIHSVVDFNMHIPGNSLVFAFLFGVLANPGAERPLNLVDRSVTGWARLLLPVLGAWMLWRAIPLLPSEYCSEMARRALRANSFLDAIAYAEKGLGKKGSPRAYTLNAGGWPSEQTMDTLLRIFDPNPRNPELYYDLGEAHRQAGMRIDDPGVRRYFYEQAANAFEVELKIFPQDENALLASGQVLAEVGRYPEAEDAYQKALALDPKLGLIYRGYASLLEAEGRKAESERILRKHKEIFGE